MVIVLMGVSGSGKTTVGKWLASDLGWAFFDGDDFHPPANVDKMRGGTPLDDTDRGAWLDALAALVGRLVADGRSAVLACSALRSAYRERLRAGHERQVALVYLRGNPELIRARLEARTGHFMKARLLDSQLAALEEPADAVVVDVDATPAEIAAEIRRALRLE